MVRKSKGRQKIEMTRMSNESNLLVTFSKRRSGLFKKASEICTLCGAEIAIVVFSPAKKPFSFGHPTVAAVSDRFLSRRNLPPPPMPPDSAAARELNERLKEAVDRLEAERRRGEERRRRTENREKGWWEGPVDEFGLYQLEQLKVAMEDLKSSVAKQAERVRVEVFSGPGCFVGSSSVGGGYSGGGSGPGPGPDVDIKVSGLGLSMTLHGYAPGYGNWFF
ncbi:agamous-like MADS-box protein AGL62 [Actinidia eriantha]|uniref:agamous-like MADS-box protein AGL62 n=1 Tax=Actinidia eriantha TaxID=165200 RepID=UPI0025907C1F|nr:agamous-like MADS-box protein AGL62 [Actinidia eriantha]